MAQTVYLAKDIQLTIRDTDSNGDGTGSAVALHGIGNGLRAVRWGDPSAIAAKAGTGNYEEKYDTGRRRPTCTVVTQLGSVIYPQLVGQHGELKEFVFTPRSGTAITFKAFIVEPEFAYDTEADGIDADFELMISGAPT